MPSMTAGATDSTDPQLATLLGHSAVPAGIREAIGKPAGARFFRCALQVNPFAYTTRHAKQTPFKNEDEYNAAIVAACVKEGIEVVGITDHFRIATSQNLAAALTAAGIHVLVGFEASSSEGVHLLCLFLGSTAPHDLERMIGACGVTLTDADSPQSDKSCEQLLQLIPRLGGITIAAHACSSSGLLVTLKGQTRSRVWTNPDLMAIALPGPRSGAPEACRDIIANKDPAHARPRLVAVMNANDVSSPAALSDPSTTTWIKRVTPSIDGLRQAFLDSESRIRLNSDPKPTSHTELIAMSWAGGLLDGQSLRFNESLNVLVGGRGAGKSTLIEGLRYAFDLPPKGDEARRTHESMVKSVFGQGATISVLIRSPLPSPQYYLIERIYGSRPRVRDQNGDLLQNVSPRSVLGSLEVYGQHEISELTRFPEKLAQLLRRFNVRPSATLDQLEAVIRKYCSGNFSQALERLRSKDDLSLTDLGLTVAEGTAALVSKYGFSQSAAERIAKGGTALALEIEECEVPAEAVLELNVGNEKAQTWKELDQLSTGQKATAVLLLLLLESDAPLIVDQPEDDLDNRFIADCIVPTMRDEKKKRQFIFSTHNANIPVLGDAEQIVGLTPVVEGGIEHATIPDGLCGSIDTPAIKEMIKDLLEGGQEAFEFRKQKYGF